MCYLYKKITILLVIFFSLNAYGGLLQAEEFESRSINGTGNNLKYTTYGAAEVPLLRLVKNEYEDGISALAGENRPNPRWISNVLGAQEADIFNQNNLTDMVWQWGQFLDHDIDLTPDNSEEPYFIEVPLGDLFFDPFGTGEQEIAFFRSISIEGDHMSHPRRQLNVITAFIDASNVYGSDDIRASVMRSGEKGKLLMSDDGGYLPYNEFGMPNAGGPSSSLYLAGDVRANEQIGLTAMHTLFAKEHNRLCDEIYDNDPSLSDEEIYQIARKIVGAEIQVITYHEFLPLIIGDGAISEYKGYKRSVDPGISTEFSTAAYRFGHSMLSDELLRIDQDDNEIYVPLRDAFFNPSIISEDGGIDSILLGLSNQIAQEIDNKLVDSVRNFLFGPPGAGGFDLASLNIQRGRDHGLANYNKVRIKLGIGPVHAFSEITTDPELQEALEIAYGGDVHNIDLWAGGLAEDHVNGGMVGLTFQTIIKDQFERLRDGDRFWYQNDPFFINHPELLDDIENTTLGEIIRRNTDLGDRIRDNVFELEL